MKTVTFDESVWQLVPKDPHNADMEYSVMDGYVGKLEDAFRNIENYIRAAPPAPLETSSAVRDRAFEEAAKACDDNGWARSDTGAKASNVIRALKVKP